MGRIIMQYYNEQFPVHKFYFTLLFTLLLQVLQVLLVNRKLFSNVFQRNIYILTTIGIKSQWAAFLRKEISTNLNRSAYWLSAY